VAVLRWAAVAGAIVVAFVAAEWFFSNALSRMARERALGGLREAFASEIEIKNLEVSVFPRLQATGEGLVLRFKSRKDLPPLITIRRLTAEGGLFALLRGRIGQVRLEGLEIQVPPKGEGGPSEKKTNRQKIPGFVADEIVADGTVLKTLPKDPGKEPLVWEIRRLTLHGAGPSSPMSFRATLWNAKPPGEIESTRKFGPWQTEEPEDTPVSGEYTFQNADLSVFRGIGGTMSSQGTYHGVLERIEVQGHTEAPDFTLKVSSNPANLKTQFYAVVDGTDGNTWLQPVTAQFGRSSVEAHGGIEGIEGVKGKTVSLDVTVLQGRLEDMLRLGVKGPKPIVSGMVGFQARLAIPPGDVDIAQKMTLEGKFQAVSAHFSQLDIQEKVNKLSHGGQGEPEARATDTVASDFGGRFKLANGVMTFRDSTFRVPGVSIALDGRYGLLDEAMEFHGTARLEAKLSQTTTGFKSFLLKAVDPFFRKKDAGAVIPIKITGTRDKPSFGLDLGPHK
jgi:hypothetical protein